MFCAARSSYRLLLQATSRRTIGSFAPTVALLEKPRSISTTTTVLQNLNESKTPDETYATEGFSDLHQSSYGHEAQKPLWDEKSDSESKGKGEDKIKSDVDIDSVSDDSYIASLTKKMLTTGIFGQEDVWFSSAEEIVNDNLNGKAETLTKEQEETMITTEMAKTATVGAATGALGIILLPVGLPAALVSSWLLQTRVSAAIAYGRGYDLKDPEVQTRVLLSLVGGSSEDSLRKIADSDASQDQMIKKFAQEFGTVRLPLSLVGQMQRLVVREVARHAAKRGAAVTAGRALPFVGAVVGGTVDTLALRKTAENAQKIFSV